MQINKDFTSTKYRRMIGKYLRDIRQQVLSNNKVIKEVIDGWREELLHWLRCGMLIRAIDNVIQERLEDQLYSLCRQLYNKLEA